MRKPAPLLAVGFPDFWETIHRKYAPVFTEAVKLASLESQLLKREVDLPLHRVLRLIARSAANSFGAIVTLVLNGYGADAMRIARSMFEADVVMAYLRKHPDAVGDFIDHSAAAAKRSYDYMREHAPDMLQQVDPKAVADVEKRFAKLPSQRSKSIRWTPKTLKVMAKDVGLTEIYETFYSWASSIHHADISGLFYQAEAPNYDIEAAPSERWVEVALNIGHGSLLRILNNYNEAAELGMDDQIERRIAGFKKAWRSKST